MKNLKISEKEMMRLLKTWLRNTGQMIPLTPEHVKAFLTANPSNPDPGTTRIDPLDILKQGYKSYDTKHPETIKAEKPDLSLAMFRNGAELSEETINEILRILKEEPPYNHNNSELN